MLLSAQYFYNIHRFCIRCFSDKNLITSIELTTTLRLHDEARGNLDDKRCQIIKRQLFEDNYLTITRESRTRRT